MDNKKNSKKPAANSFRGNQHVPGKPKKGRKQKSNRPKQRASDKFSSSTSANKIRLEDEMTDSNTNFIFFMHFSVLNCIIRAVFGHAATCKAKNPNMLVELLADQKMGFAQNLKICCLSYQWKIETFTSPEIETIWHPLKITKDSL